MDQLRRTSRAPQPALTSLKNMLYGARRLVFMAIYAALAGLLPPAACAASDVNGAAIPELDEPQPLLEVRRQAAAEGKGTTLVMEEKEEGSEKR